MDIQWKGIEEPDYDLCYKVDGKYYEVLDGVDGWVVYTPTERWVHDGQTWSGAHKDRAPERGKRGAVTRDEARLFAETLIPKILSGNQVVESIDSTLESVLLRPRMYGNHQEIQTMFFCLLELRMKILGDDRRFMDVYRTVVCRNHKGCAALAVESVSWEWFEPRLKLLIQKVKDPEFKVPKDNTPCPCSLCTSQ